MVQRPHYNEIKKLDDEYYKNGFMKKVIDNLNDSRI